MKLIKKFWAFLGTSGAWIALFIIVLTVELIAGPSLKGMFYSALFLVSYFLCRISEEISKISKD